MLPATPVPDGEKLDLPGTLRAKTIKGLGMKAKGRGCVVEELLQTLTKQAHLSLSRLLFTLLPSLTLP